MGRVQLIHWNSAEAKQRAERLKDLGHEVAYEVPQGPDFLSDLRKNPPIAVVIDLARLPSRGRDVALAIRQHRATRHVPLVFTGGDPKKVVGIKQILPDAVYTSWNQIRSSLKRAITHPPADPVVPRSLLEGYSGTPLPKKLGIKTDSVVALVGAPEGFREVLGRLPEGALLREQARSECDLLIWFVRSHKHLQRGIERMAARIEQGSLWIVWPKKTSPLATDLSEQDVREVGLAAGLVDYKICAIDATWSGLLLTRRKSK